MVAFRLSGKGKTVIKKNNCGDLIEGQMAGDDGELLARGVGGDPTLARSPRVSHRHKYDTSNQRCPAVPADEVTTVNYLTDCFKGTLHTCSLKGTVHPKTIVCRMLVKTKL